MNLFKKIGVIILSSGFLFTSSFFGCRSLQTYPNYHINKQIGEEKIHFYESLNGKKNYLEVTVANKMKKYLDTDGDDLRIESVETYKNGEFVERFDMKDPLGRAVLELEQLRFDIYLDKIKEEKINKLDGHLK